MILSMVGIDQRITARTKEVQAAYDAKRAAYRALYGDVKPPCTFCVDSERTVIEDLGGAYVCKNDFPYSVFDGRKIKDHLMIVPKSHDSSFGGFSESELADYWTLLAKYHIDGYSSMTRSATDSFRSVPEHLHTHLFLYFT